MDDAQVPLSTDDLAAAMPRVPMDVPGPCSPHRFPHNTDHAEVLECHDDGHSITVPEQKANVYAALRALENAGSVRRLKVDGSARVYWRSTRPRPDYEEAIRNA